MGHFSISHVLRSLTTINCVKVTRCALAKDTNKGLERSLQVACFEQLKKNIEEQVLKNST